MRSPPNWTAVGFFGCLSLMHWMIALPSILNGRWEAHLSLIFGAAFALVAAGCWLFCREVAVMSSRGQVRIRTGLCALRTERTIPFEQVRGVRLTLSGRGGDSQIEMICDEGGIDCPVTPVPRQQALCMAILMHVNLTKVIGEGTADATSREPVETDPQAHETP